MIPKKIHYCWFGGNPIPNKDKKCIESWRKKCPDYEIIEWNESNYDVNKNKYMKQAYEAKKWGFVPDYARLDIIYNEGGIYLDTDVEIIKPLDDLLLDKGFAGIEGTESKEAIALGLGFAAEKGNPIIKKLLESYDEILFINDDGTLNLTPSPVYSTEKMLEAGFVLNGLKQTIDGFTVYPKEYFCPRDYHTGKLSKTKNTYTIHWYNASWKTPHQKRMMKLRHTIGVKNYYRLVDIKNKLLRK